MTPDQRADLEQSYLLALLKRDAKIWHAYYGAQSLLTAYDDDSGEILSPLEASRVITRDRPRVYEGARCLKCGGTERYISNSGCVACVKATAKRASELKAGRKRAQSEAEKEKRRAAWTPERREAMRQRTASHGKSGGRVRRAVAKPPPIWNRKPVVVPRTPIKFVHTEYGKARRFASK